MKNAILKNMPTLPLKTFQALSMLSVHGVKSYLYGSQAVSIYLGNFRKFDDIDLLTTSNWLAEDWLHLCAILDNNGFKLSDEKEHEFIDSKGTVLAFADVNILTRDKIVHNINDAIVEVSIDGNIIRTFKPEVLLLVYEFSIQDGYRQQTRGKNDAEIIRLLKIYIEKQSNK